MTIQALRSFCAIVEAGSITTAAEKLYISQPALSITLKKLETELDTSLFERQGRSIYLTESGKYFYRFASSTLTSWEETLDMIKAEDSNSGQLKIGCCGHIFSDYLLPVFMADNPDIEISINSADHNRIEQLLKNRTYDIILSGKGKVHDKSEIQKKVFYKNRLCASVPLSNPLSSHETLELKDIAAEKIIRINKIGEFTEDIDKKLKKENIHLNVTQRVNFEIINVLEKQTDYIYFMSALQAEFDKVPDNRVLVPISGNEFVRTASLFYLKSKKKKVEVFENWIKAQWKDLPGSNPDNNPC